MIASSSIVLVSLPWNPIYLPSIQVALLGSYLDSKGIKANCKNFYLDYANAFGIDNYFNLLWNGLGEIYFSDLLFNRKESNAKLYREQNNENYKRLKISNRAILEGIEKTSSKCIDELLALNPDVIGFTVTFHQLMSSLYFASKIKIIAPKVKIVFGGSFLNEGRAKELLGKFEFVDHAIVGEGEKKLLDLLSNKTTSHPINQKSYIDETYYPDYSEFFQRLKTFPGLYRKIKTRILIPTEGSRGCWWNRCVFCSLSGKDAHKFRAKAPRIIAEELKEQSKRYKVFNFFFTDLINFQIGKLSKEIIETELDLNLFMQCRPELSSTDVAQMKQAGFTIVQLGVESFSTSILKKMDKGVNVIQIIFSLKLLYQNQITVLYNLIPRFPVETKEEVEQIIEIIPFLYHLPPAQTLSEFQLGHGSIVYEQYGEYNISKIKASKIHSMMFPKRIRDSITPIRYDYVLCEDKDTQNAWKEVEKELQKWRKKYKDGVELSYRDGKDFLLISDTRFGNKKSYKLNEIERKIFLECNKIISYEDLKEKNKTLENKELYRILSSFYKQKLIVEDEGRILNLAFQERG